MITDLKELEKFFKICRKQGVTDISFQGISVKFGDLPVKVNTQMEEEEDPADPLSPDELIYYAVQNAGQV